MHEIRAWVLRKAAMAGGMVECWSGSLGVMVGVFAGSFGGDAVEKNID
jgi:hypothetical protein